MGPIDLVLVEQRARRAYEFARLRRALLGIAPFALVFGLAAFVVQRPAVTIAFALAALPMGAVMLWYGREPQKAVLPGFAAGLVPFALTLGSTRLYMWQLQGCGPLCLTACALGGALAGLAIAKVGARRPGAGFWLPASALALLTGAAGCACIGYLGVIGLGSGFAVGMTVSLITFRRSAR